MRNDLDDLERRELRRKARVAMLAALESLGGEAKRSELHRHARERGPFTARERAARPPGARFERLVDTYLAVTLNELRREGIVPKSGRGTWRTRFRRSANTVS